MPQRVFVGTSTVTLKTSTEAGVLTAASTVTVAGSAHDGTTVTLGSVSTGSTGIYTASMTVLVPTLVTLTWTVDGVARADTIDVVSAPYVTVEETKAAHSSLSAATNVADAIEDAEAECQHLTGRAWRKRYDVVELAPDAFGCVRLPWPHVRRIGKVVVTSSDGVATTLTSTQWLLRPGGVLDVSAQSTDRVEVGFEHGMVEPDREIRRAVLIRARQLAQADVSKVPLYSERVVMDGGGSTMVRLLPGAMSTGVAEVDAVYRRHAYAAGIGIA